MKSLHHFQSAYRGISRPKHNTMSFWTFTDLYHPIMLLLCCSPRSCHGPQRQKRPWSSRLCSNIKTLIKQSQVTWAYKGTTFHHQATSERRAPEQGKCLKGKTSTLTLSSSHHWGRISSVSFSIPSHFVTLSDVHKENCLWSVTQHLEYVHL